MKEIIVIGGGLAGSEAALQIAKRGIKVKLYEMKPVKFSPAHSNRDLAEVVCSNSFKSNLLTNACGLLKEELRILDSLLIKCADETSVPAGQALAVDREKFSALVTKKIKENPNGYWSGTEGKTIYKQFCERAKDAIRRHDKDTKFRVIEGEIKDDAQYWTGYKFVKENEGVLRYLMATK